MFYLQYNIHSVYSKEFLQKNPLIAFIKTIKGNYSILIRVALIEKES